MISYIRHLQLELNFLFKNWLFIIGPLLYLVSIYIWLTLQGPYQREQPFLQRTNEFLAVGHTVTLGVMFLASVLSIRREKQTVMLDWTNSLPTSYRGIIFAKFSAINLYSLIYTIIFFVSFIAIGLIQDETMDFLVDHGWVLAFQSQVSYFVSIALGMFLAAMIPNRIVYIIAFCAWMFGTFFMEGFIIQSYRLYYLKTFHLSQFFLAQNPSEGWAFDLAQKEAWLSRIFVFFFSLLLLSLTVWRSGTNRLSSKKRSAAIGVALIIVLTITSAAPYTHFWTERITKSEKLFRHAVDQEENLEESETDFTSFIETENYRMAVERVGDSTILVESEIIMGILKENHLTFTLYPTFEIDSITWNGKELDYHRESSNVTLENLENNSPNILSVSYQGTVNEWGYSYSGENNFAFLQGNNMFFPSYIAWYPIMGEFPVYEKFVNGPDKNLFTNFYHRSADLSRNIPPTNFSVTLVGFEQPVFGTYSAASRLPDGSIEITSENTPGLTLFSKSSLVEKELAFGTNIISTEKHIKQIEKELGNLDGILPYLNSWLAIGNNHKKKFVYLPSFEYTGSRIHYINTIDDAFFADEKSRGFLYSYEVDDTDDLYLDVQGHFITDLLFKHYPHNPYAAWGDSTIYNGMIQAYLLVVFKEYYQFSWDDFRRLGRTNYSNLAYLGHLDHEEGSTIDEKLENRLSREDLEPEEEMVYLVAKEWEKGNKEEVKQFLREVHEEMKESSTPGYSYYDWKNKWNKVIPK